MKRNSLSSKLLRTSIVVTAILILIVFSMFFQYYMKIQKTIQDEQMRMLSENVTARADSAFVSLDDIALQLSTNSYITETMRTLLEDDTSGDIFEEDLRLARYLQSFIWSYIIRSDVATRICIYNRNGDFLNTGSSADSACAFPSIMISSAGWDCSRRGSTRTACCSAIRILPITPTKSPRAGLTRPPSSPRGCC